MKTLSLISIALILSIYCSAQGENSQAGTSSVRARKGETQHLAFFSEYIRELSAIDKIRTSANRELKERQDAKEGIFSSSIHSSTLFQLELGSQIGMLEGIRLRPPFADLIPSITTFYRRRIDLWKKMADISALFVAGRKPGVDYGKLGAEVPRLRAQLDFIDHALFEVTPMVFATLIDTKEDSKGH